jgi:hypothetical protein
LPARACGFESRPGHSKLRADERIEAREARASSDEVSRRAVESIRLSLARLLCQLTAHMRQEGANLGVQTIHRVADGVEGAEQVGIAEGLEGRLVSDDIVCRVPAAILEAADVNARVSKVWARGAFHCCYLSVR